MNPRNLSLASRTGEPAQNRASETPAELAPATAESTGTMPIPAQPRSRKKMVMVGLVVAALLGGGTYWYEGRAIESTDDAQVDADVVAVPARMGGVVSAVHFEENQRVVEGQLLAELEDAPARARLAQAEANYAAAVAAAQAADAQAQLSQRNARSNLAVANAGLRSSAVGAESSVAQIAEAQAHVANAKAKLDEADTNLSRTQTLFQSGAASSAQLDQMKSARDVAQTELERAQAALATVSLSRAQAETRVAEAEAKLKQSDQVDALIREAEARAAQAHAAVDTAAAQKTLAALDVSYTKISAPHAGVVSKKNINVGQTVALGQSIVQLVPSERWVTANYKETQLDHMVVGQPVEMSVDAYPDQTFRGHVSSFSGATGSRFALLPPDNATGNFTKVVQRVSVRVQLDDAKDSEKLRPGMSVDVHVDTAGKPAQVTQPRTHGV